jgi:hypothetical protein
MNGADLHEAQAQKLRVLQIIIGAMLLGTVVFLVAAQIIGPGQALEDAQIATNSFVTYVACAYAAMAIVIASMAPAFIANVKLRKMREEMPAAEEDVDNDAQLETLLTIFHTKIIVGAAVFEGAALLTIVAYLLEGKPLAVGVAIVLMVLLARQFPTRSRMNDWLDLHHRGLGDG